MWYGVWVEFDHWARHLYVVVSCTTGQYHGLTTYLLLWLLLTYGLTITKILHVHLESTFMHNSTHNCLQFVCVFMHGSTLYCNNSLRMEPKIFSLVHTWSHWAPKHCLVVVLCTLANYSIRETSLDKWSTLHAHCNYFITYLASFHQKCATVVHTCIPSLRRD